MMRAAGGAGFNGDLQGNSTRCQVLFQGIPDAGQVDAIVFSRGCLLAVEDRRQKPTGAVQWCGGAELPPESLPHHNLIFVLALVLCIAD